MRAAFTFFPVKKSKQKRPVQKKAIAKHRAFSSQNAFSIALIIIRLFFVTHIGDRRTFDSSFTIACFLNDIPFSASPI
ncbi:MAG: hypothetical protein RIR48_2449 [Bacteroidota bacterium]